MAQQITNSKLLGTELLRSKERIAAAASNGIAGALLAADNPGNAIEVLLKATGEWRSGEVPTVVGNPAFDVYRRANGAGVPYNSFTVQDAGNNFPFGTKFLDEGVYCGKGKFIDGALWVTELSGEVTNNDVSDAKISLVMEPNGNANALSGAEFWALPGTGNRLNAFLMETASANSIPASSGTNQLKITIVGHAYRDATSGDQGQVWAAYFTSDLAITFVSSVDFVGETVTTRDYPYYEAVMVDLAPGGGKAYDYDANDTMMNFSFGILGPGDGSTLLQVYSLNSYLIR